MEQPTTTKLQVISEIVKLLKITPEEMKEINADFQELVRENGTTTEELIAACEIYHKPSFLAGAMISTTVCELVGGIMDQKQAELSRLSTDNMEVI